MNVRHRTTGFSNRLFAEQALSRSAGAPLIGGNAVEVLIDARAHFDAWLAAIAAAMRARNSSIRASNSGGFAPRAWAE